VVVDEWTRECLAIDVARQLSSDDVLERISWLMATRGVPEHVRSDNGSEFTATAVREWLGKVGVKTLSIEPGSPRLHVGENGSVESLNGKLRDELLNGEIFYTVAEARVLIEGWRKHYNRVRPHSALGYRPPAPEAIAAGPPSASLRAVQQQLSDRTTTASTVDSTAGEGPRLQIIKREPHRNDAAILHGDARGGGPT
jgi:transposase InsO family protein